MLNVLFGSKTRAGIIEVLTTHDALGLRALAREVGTGISSVQAELERLESIGLVRSVRRDGKRMVSLDASHPFALSLRGLVAAEPLATYGTPALAERVNPLFAPLIQGVVDACKRHGVRRAAVVGSCADPNPLVLPNDLDLLVRMGPELAGYGQRFLGLLVELESLTGMHVDLIDQGALTKDHLRRSFAETEVVLYEE